MSDKVLDAYIGCDPGAKGAMCLLVPSANYIEIIDHTSDMTLIHTKLIEWSIDYKIKKVMIEDVHSLFGMSAKSNFNFGYNLGYLYGLVQSLFLGIDKVTPKIWQKTVGVKPKDPAIKKTVAKIARTLYPNCDIYGTRGGLKDGRSDALMLAHYCYLKYK